ncbi:MAG: 30S ribosome-binding factor RbfA [Spirochaetes bacterium]|nr:30S ribosome-binding factor RbfA [Spirochaetota bacterium]
MAGYRKERIEKQIRMIIADSLLKDIKDPRIGFVTVTEVKLNKDKSIAFTSVSIMGDQTEKKKTLKGLNSAKGYLQFKVGKAIKMRSTPKIVFQLDTTIETGAEILGTLGKIEKEEKKDILEESDITEQDS